MNILTAGNGEDSIKIFLENSVDILIIDENMPEMNGSEAIKTIRKLPQGQDVFICSLTGDTDNDILSYIQSAGADKVLSKPIKNSLLKEIIQNNAKR